MKHIFSGVILSFSLILGGCNSTGEVKEVNLTEVDEDADKSATEIFEERAQEYKEKKGITLESKDIQFDMVNNLDKSFLLGGYGELSSYYNYGYTNESKFFSVLLTPFDDSDSWYVYFDRKLYHELFDKLKENQLTAIYIDAVIPSNVYQPSQGNMAVAKAAKF